MAGGILAFENLEELSEILDSLTPELYEDMKIGIVRNYELVTKAYENMSPMHAMWQVGCMNSFACKYTCYRPF